MPSCDQISYTITRVPPNSGYLVIADSTRGVAFLPAAGTTNPAPGDYRGRWPGAVISYSVLTTTQNVTFTEEILTGVAGTNADFDTQGTGTGTVTAGTETVREFRPLTQDWRILLTAGATGPATCTVKVLIRFTNDSGS